MKISWDIRYPAVLAITAALLPAPGFASEKPEKKAPSPALTALMTTTKTFSLMGTTLYSSFKAIRQLGGPLRSPVPAVASGAAKPPVEELTGYTGEEYRASCAHCGGASTVRGRIPGMIVHCPSCGETVTS